MPDNLKKNTGSVLVVLLSACLLANLFLCYGKGSLSSTLYEIILKKDTRSILPVLALDNLWSKLPKGNAFLRFEGFAPGSEPAKRTVPLIFFRSVFAYYPGKIFTGDTDLNIKSGNEFLENPFVPDEGWLARNMIDFQVTFKRDTSGNITTEIKETSKATFPVQGGSMFPFMMRILLIAAFLIAILAVSGKIKGLPPPWPEMQYRSISTDPVSIFSLVTIFVMFLIVCCHSLLTPLYEWDAFAIWGFKAKVLFQEGFGSSYFTDPNLAYSHLDYPLLVPALMSAGLFHSASNADQMTCKFIFPVLYLAFVFLVYRMARWKLPEKHSLLLAAVFASTPALVRWSGAGTADMALSFFYAGSIFHLFKFHEEEEFTDFLASIAFSACCAYTKNEGLALAIINIAVLAIFSVRPSVSIRNFGTSAIYAMAFLVLYAPWILFSYGIPKIHENYLGNLTIAKIIENSGRLGTIFENLSLQFLSLKGWGLVWMLMAAGLIMGRKHFEWKTALMAWTLFIGHVLLYALIYLIYPYNLAELIPQTIDRLYLHLLPAGILILVIHFSNPQEETAKRPDITG